LPVFSHIYTFGQSFVHLLQAAFAAGNLGFCCVRAYGQAARPYQGLPDVYVIFKILFVLVKILDICAQCMLVIFVGHAPADSGSSAGHDAHCDTAFADVPQVLLGLYAVDLKGQISTSVGYDSVGCESSEVLRDHVVQAMEGLLWAHFNT
jgi:hypothetical protein